MISFTRLNQDHLTLVVRWLSQGEALRWYGRGIQSEQEIEKRYLAKTRSDSKTKGYIIESEGSAIGYFQFYRISDHPSYYERISALPGDYGIDLFIGEDSLIGLGLGERIIKKALENLVFAQIEVKRCVTGPAPENLRAIKCYKKCGFEHLSIIEFPSGDHEYIMALEKSNLAGAHNGGNRSPLSSRSLEC